MSHERFICVRLSFDSKALCKGQYENDCRGEKGEDPPQPYL